MTLPSPITITGAKLTAARLVQRPRIVADPVRFTTETDSLNASILGPDAVPGTPEFDLFVAEVKREMVSKAGQKCTAIRRIIAPAAVSADLVRALSAELGKLRIGNPAADVDMGALASLGQREEVRARVAELAEEAEVVYGNGEDVPLTDANPQKGAFFLPTLLLCERPLAA